MRPRYIGYDKYVLVSSVELKIAWISPLLVSIKLPTECIFQQDRISALGWFESHLMVQNRFLLVISSLYSQVLLEGYRSDVFFYTSADTGIQYLKRAARVSVRPSVFPCRFLHPQQDTPNAVEFSDVPCLHPRTHSNKTTARRRV